MDWADQKALAKAVIGKLGSYVGMHPDVRSKGVELVEKALRDVQRETAEECCKHKCLHCEKGEPVEQTRFGSWCHQDHFCAAASIRERFNPEGK